MNSVEKTLVVLGALAGHDQPRRLADIARRTGINKTTVHRILQIFIAQGYAVSHGDGTYASGPAILALAGAALTDRDMTTLVRPILENLQRNTTHTVHFAIRSGSSAVYLAKVESQQPYRMASRVGTQIALHCTAIGKAILAHLPEEEVRAVLAATAPLISNTPATIVDPALLMAELESVRQRGYAVDDEENEPNVRCVAAVAHDAAGTVVGAVSVAGLTISLNKDDVPLLGPLVVAAAARVSAALGRNA
ncbi:IclR family transcriptional regulator [Nonomuraea zeae]|uniref:IclR family transcriptional regulator n=1 Tax=Nonomuraea zeae TaxID=1642303 RepID=UPI001981FD1B|nr:IclR family transcriptional regulator [Nonomuraea zeae]